MKIGYAQIEVVASVPIGPFQQNSLILHPELNSAYPSESCFDISKPSQMATLLDYKSNSKRFSIFIPIVKNRDFDRKYPLRVSLSGYSNIAIIYFEFLASQK